jgi:hypothetical protein
VQPYGIGMVSQWYISQLMIIRVAPWTPRNLRVISHSGDTAAEAPAIKTLIIHGGISSNIEFFTKISKYCILYTIGNPRERTVSWGNFMTLAAKYIIASSPRSISRFSMISIMKSWEWAWRDKVK